MSDYDALEMEGMVTTLTVLRVLSGDLEGFRQALRTKVRQMPGFFNEAPVALDFSAFDGTDEGGAVPELAAVVALLREEHLVPVAVRNASARIQADAQTLGLASLRGSARAGGARSNRGSDGAQRGGSRAAAEGEFEQAAPTLMLRQPVRGGQVVYAERGDAVVLSSVNSGGELIADGNIHVYGALRGRALAGAHGNAQARIFCTNLQADLVSIAGTYLRADELPEAYRGKPAQIYLNGDALVVTGL